ncbi:MAG: HYR domain-containing protein, partial [Saprospirales bacterium]
FQSPQAGSSVSIGTHTILIEAEDESGNASSCTVSLSVLDTIPPVVSCDPDTLYLGPACEVSLPDYLADADVTDNCDTTFTTDQYPEMGALIDSAGTYDVLLSFTDQSGNTGTCNVEVEVIDTIAPTIGCPGSITLILDFNCEAHLGDYTGSASTGDNCDGPLTVTQNPAQGFTMTGVDTQMVFLEVEDGSGNTAECSFSVITTDTLPPTLTCPVVTDSIYVDGSCDALVPDYVSMVSASDSCGIASVTQYPAMGDSIGLGVHTVVLTAEDNNGNISTCNIELTVLDTMAPTLICVDQAVFLDDSCSAVLPDYSDDLTISDNCDTAFTVVQSPAPGTVLDSAGTLVVNFMVTDSSGNTSECDISVELLDTIGPSISCMGTFTMYLDENCEALLPGFAPSNITVNCDINPVITQSIPAGVPFTSPATFNVFLTIEDEFGNTDDCVIGVVVEDTLAPQVACIISTDTVYVDNYCGATLPDYLNDTAFVDISDNCSLATTAQYPDAGELLQPGQLTVEISAEDASGNSAYCQIEVTVLDTIAPEVMCDDQIVYLDQNCSAELPDFSGEIDIQDNCDSAFTVVQSPAPGAVLDSTGILAVNFMVTDSSGNTAECDISVELVDSIGPSISCMGSFAMYLDENCEAALPGFSPSETELTCDTVPVLTQVPSAGTTFTSPTSFNVVLTIEDKYGNSDECVIGVEVKDTTAPQVACLITADTVFVDGDCEALVPDFANDTASVSISDNCGITSVSQYPAASEVLQPGQYTVEVSAEDNSGNTASCNIELVVLDTISPQLTCPEGPFEIVLDDEDCTAELGDFTTHEGLMAVDNCDDSLSFVQTPAAGHLLTAPGPLTVVIEGTDESGNTSTCQVDVNVVDEVAPEILCPVSITMPIFGDCESFMPLLTHTPIIMDNCDTAFTVTQTPAGFTPVMGTEASVVEITVTDMSGNSTTCAVDVFFDDQEPPSIACPSSLDTILVDDQCVANLPDYLDGLQVDDNCGIDTVYQSPEAGAEVTVGDHTVTIVAMDVNGNSSTCEVTLTVEDDMAPVVSDCQDLEIYLDELCSAEVPDLLSQVGSANDNCTAEGDLIFEQSVEQGTALNAPDTIDVVLSFTDESGNSGDCEISVFAIDTIPPTLNCSTSVVLFLDENEEATLGNLSSLVDAMDNCDADPEVTQDPTPSHVFTEAGFFDVMMTATDASGNSDYCIITAEVRDTLCPGLICLISHDTVYVASNNCEVSVQDYTLSVNTSSDCEPVDVEQSIEAGTLVGPGSYQITITAKDSVGNSDECVINLEVIDDTPPVVECPASSETIFLDGDCTVDIPDYLAQSHISDNCDTNGLNTQQSPAPGTGFSGQQTVSVVVSATDLSGNTGSCTVEVNIVDNQPPVVDCPATLTELLDADCEAQVPDLTGHADISDNCDVGDLTVVQSPIAGTTVNGTNSVTISLDVTDAGGNSASCTVTLELVDEAPPVFANCPPDFSFEISPDSCEGEVDVDELIATDNCTSVSIENDYNDGGADASGIYPLGTTEVVFTASDQNGNTSTCLLVVEVDDNAPPVVTSCPADVTVDCGQPTDPYFTGGLAEGENICNGEVFVTYTDDVDGEYCEDRVITRTFILTDDVGNADSSCVQTVTVSNDQGPVVVNCPDDIMVDLDTGTCEATVELPEDIEAYNSCYHESFEFSGYTPGSFPEVPSLSFNRNESDLVRIRGFFFTPFPNPGNISPYPATHGNYHGIIKSEDVGASNSGVFSRLGGYSSFFGGGFEASIDVYIELSDPAVQNNTYGWDLGTAVNDQSGDKLRDYFFHVSSNASGQVLIGSSNATDSTRKTDIASGNHTVVSGSRWLRFIWTFDDNGDGTMQATLKVTRLNGTVIYTETYNDQSDLISSVVGGNRDMSFPFLEVNDLSVDNIRLKYFPVSTSCDLAGTQTFGPGVHLISCVAEDACGNETECTYTVHVTGDDDLALDCPDTVEADVDQGECFASINLEADLTIGCDTSITVVNTATDGGIDASGNYAVGITSVVFTATNSAGESVSCTTTVEISGGDVDQIEVACPDDEVVVAEMGVCTAQVSLDSAELILGCEVDDPLTIVNDFNTGGADASGTYSVGIHTVTFTATDGSSNFASCTMTVEVVDNEAPVADCSDITLELDADGNAEVIQTQLELMFSDNCGVDEVTISKSTFDCDDIGSNTVVLTAEDESGNSATCTINVEVEDNLPPVLTCPASVIADADQGECFASVSVSASASDNCDLDEISNDFNSGGLNASGQYEVGTNVVIFTAVDGEGNSSQCTTTVEVSGDAGPGVAITCPDDVVVANDASECNAFVNLPEADVDVGCGAEEPVTVENTHNAGGEDASGTYPVGTTIVTFTATDAASNSASCTTAVTVNDEETPVADCIDITIELDSNNMATLEESDFEFMFLDNCEIDSLGASKTEFDCDLIGFNNVNLSATDASGNSSTCNIWVNVMPGQSTCQPITLQLDTISAQPGQSVCVPIRVENFENVAGLQGSIYSPDSNVFKITGLTNIGLSPGVFLSNLIGDTLTYSWFYVNGLNKADGEEILCLNIDITGDVGDEANIVFSNSPTIIEVSTVNATVQAVNALHLDGLVQIEPDTGGIAGLHGGVSTAYGMPVGGVSIQVNGLEFEYGIAFSDELGNYSLDIPAGQTVEVVPQKNGNKLDGISTLDMVHIQQHILGLQKLDSPYKIIAADINADNVISTFDLVILQANLVGARDDFAGNSSWRFIPEDHVFDNPANPFESKFPESRWYESLNGDWFDQDWVAVKVGDVNETLNPVNTAESRSARMDYAFEIGSAEYRTGGIVAMPVKLDDMAGLTGFQFSLAVDFRVGRIVGLEMADEGILNAGQMRYHIDQSSDLLNVSWYNGKGVNATAGMAEFFLLIQAEESAFAGVDNPEFNMAGLYPEAYDLSGNLYDLTIDGEVTELLDGSVFELFQNRPNPFTDQTVISYILPGEENVVLTVYSQDGRLVKSVETRGYPGVNEILLNTEELSSGLYYYRLNAGSFMGAKTMIKVD